MSFVEPIGENTPFSSLSEYDVSSRVMFKIAEPNKDGKLTSFDLSKGFGCYDWNNNKIYVYISDALHWDVYNLPKEQIMHEMLYSVPVLCILDSVNRKCKVSIRTTKEGVPLFYIQREKSEGRYKFFDDRESIPASDLLYFKHDKMWRVCQIQLKPQQWVMRVRRYEEQPGKYFDTKTIVLTNWDDENVAYKITLDAEFESNGTSTAQIQVIDFEGTKSWLKLLPTGFFAIKSIEDDSEWEFTHNVVCLGPNRNAFVLYCVSEKTSLQYYKFNPFQDLLE